MLLHTMHQQENIYKLEKVASEATDTEFALHNAEQEIVRLQSIIDSVGIIHPGTIKQLDMMGQNNKFEFNDGKMLFKWYRCHQKSKHQ